MSGVTAEYLQLLPPADRLFQGKHRWIELKNAHDFPFVGQKGGFERIDPDMLFGCSKGVCAAAKASAGGVIEFMTDGSVIELSVVMKQYLSAFDQPQMPLSSYAGIDYYVKIRKAISGRGILPPTDGLGQRCGIQFIFVRIKRKRCIR
mgnify:CR=1 FL=1